MKWFLDVLRGAVIGLANVIPGVSGGTMMVSMGIYDKLIYSINNLFRKFKECFKILLPYLVGMLLAIVIGAFTLKKAFAVYPLPTNALFIGLILGSLPIILKAMKGEKIGWQGILAFVLLFGLVVGLKLVEADNRTAISLNVGTVLLMVLLGAICSAAMVIPGVSGSMILKIQDMERLIDTFSSLDTRYRRAYAVMADLDAVVMDGMARGEFPAWCFVPYKADGDVIFEFSHFEVDLREPDQRYRTLYVVYRYDTTVS